MRSRILTAAGVGALAVAVATTLALPANAASHQVGVASAKSVHSAAKPMKGKKIKYCYQQQDDDNGIGIVSQNFESSLDAYDSQGADDFTLTKKCKVTNIEFNGAYFNGSGPATDFSITIYQDNGSSAPGKVVYGPKAESFTTTGTDGYSITGLSGIKLAPGTYWLSVQADLNYSSGGEWGWNTNNTVRGDAAMWQNPGDGFATGCTSYTTLTTCIASGEGGDFSFAITTGKKKHHK
jgi:hypothetical protein